MPTIIAATTVSLAAFTAIFIGLMLSALIWAVAYSFLGLVFSETMVAFQQSVGLEKVAPWQFGVICGWLSIIIRGTGVTATKTE